MFTWKPYVLLHSILKAFQEKYFKDELILNIEILDSAFIIFTISFDVSIINVSKCAATKNTRDNLEKQVVCLHL